MKDLAAVSDGLGMILYRTIRISHGSLSSPFPVPLLKELAKQ
jgi:hypothetical protein